MGDQGRRSNRKEYPRNHEEESRQPLQTFEEVEIFQKSHPVLKAIRTEQVGQILLASFSVDT